MHKIKSTGIDQIPAEMIKAGGRKICFEIHKLITSIWKKEKLPEEWKESIIAPIHKKGDKTDCNAAHTVFAIKLFKKKSQIRSRPIPSTSFPIHYSLMTPSLDNK